MNFRHERSRRGFFSNACSACMVVAITGCGRAPSFNILGSYFPGWILCILLSVLLTALVRMLINRLEWEHKLPALPLFYFSVAVLLACTLWLIAFE